ncbi:hypothetical protein B0H11DRAFT_1996092 [Mycena galericulata]|nr:hypothetical protein B0H11DRAFT_1996092 [Mycena galericulata]
MLSKILILASTLLGLSFVHAIPAPKASTVRLPPDGPVQVVNVGNNGTIFTFGAVAGSSEPLQVYAPQIWSWENGVWDLTNVAADTWTFQNTGTGQYIQADETDNNIVTGTSPTIFAVNSAGGGNFVIKLPYADLVWEYIYDGSSMEYGKVELRPADGSASQQWAILAA